MSVIRQQKTDISDQGCLVQGLKDLGFNPTVQEPAPIRGHYKELSKEKCGVVLRQEDTKNSSGAFRKADIGFAKQADGSFSIVTDTYVNSDLKDLKEFSAKIKVAYVKASSRKVAAKAGLVYKGTTKLPNGKTRLAFVTA
jgi:hypothetical protein